MDLPKKCVFCNITTNLNTNIDMTFDGVTYKVWVCDTHEDMSSKQIREAIKSNVGNIATLIKEIEKFGYVCVLKEEYDKLKNRIIVPKLNIEKQETTTKAAGSGQTVKFTPRIQNAQVDGTPAEPHSAYTVEREADMVLESENVKLKNGRNVPIPKSMKSSDGNTSITIVQGIDDSALQRRTNRLSQEALDPNFRGVKYGSECVACKGTGIHPISKSECPKCHGTGILGKV